MKLFKYSVLALALAAGFASCSDDETYVPGAASDGVYFPTTDSLDVELDRKVPTLDITVSRLGETEAATYQLIGSADDEVFTMPSSVSFAQGESSVVLKIPYKADNMAYDKPYKVKLAFAEGTKLSTYGYHSLDLSVVLPAPWITIGKGTYCDYWVLPIYGLHPEKYPELTNTWEVELQQHEVDKTRYRWANPYGEAFAKYCAANDIAELEPGEYDSANKYNIEFVVDAKGRAVVPWGQLTGATINEDEGMVVVGTLGGYYYVNGWSFDEIEATLPEGISTYNSKKEYETFTTPAGSMVCDFTKDGGGPYIPNYNPGGYVWWAEKVEVKDYAVKLAFNGILTDPEADTYIMVYIKLGADLSYAQVALVPGEDEEAALAAVLDGSVSTEKLEESDKSYPFYFLTSGEYVVVALGYNDDGEQVSASTLPVLAVTTTEPKEWRKLGTGIMVDAWIIPAFSVKGVRADPMSFAYNVSMEENIENPGIYRIIAPWTNAGYPGASLNANTDQTFDLVIDARNPEMVSILPQNTGFLNQGDDYSECYWATTLADVMKAYNYSDQDIVDEGADNFVYNGQIYILAPMFGVTDAVNDPAPNIQDCQYSFYNKTPYSDEEQYCPSIFQLPGAGNNAPAKVAMKRLQGNVKKQCTNSTLRAAAKYLSNNAKIKGRNAKDYCKKSSRTNL